MITDILLVLLIIILVAFSAFFSGSEIAYASANKLRLKKEADSGKKTAKIALYISDNYTKSIAAILAGNNLVNIACASAATVFMSRHFQNAETWTTIGLTVIILIFGVFTLRRIYRWIPPAAAGHPERHCFLNSESEQQQSCLLLQQD